MIHQLRRLKPGAAIRFGESNWRSAELPPGVRKIMNANRRPYTRLLLKKNSG